MNKCVKCSAFIAPRNDLECYKQLERTIHKPIPYCFDCLTHLTGHWLNCNGFDANNPDCMEYEKDFKVLIHHEDFIIKRNKHCRRDDELARNKENRC